MNNEFDFNKDKYTKDIRNVIEADTDISVRIIKDKVRRAMADAYGLKMGLLKSHGGGITKSSTSVHISDALSDTKVDGDNRWKWTKAGVLLHELLHHISPNGKSEKSDNDLRKHYRLKEGREYHPQGTKQNYKIKLINE